MFEFFDHAGHSHNERRPRTAAVVEALAFSSESHPGAVRREPLTHGWQEAFDFLDGRELAEKVHFGRFSVHDPADSLGHALYRTRSNHTIRATAISRRNLNLFEPQGWRTLAGFVASTARAASVPIEQRQFEGQRRFSRAGMKLNRMATRRVSTRVEGLMHHGSDLLEGLDFRRMPEWAKHVPGFCLASIASSIMVFIPKITHAGFRTCHPARAIGDEALNGKEFSGRLQNSRRRASSSMSVRGTALLKQRRLPYFHSYYTAPAPIPCTPFFCCPAVCKARQTPVYAPIRPSAVFVPRDFHTPVTRLSRRVSSCIPAIF